MSEIQMRSRLIWRRVEDGVVVSAKLPSEWRVRVAQTPTRGGSSSRLCVPYDIHWTRESTRRVAHHDLHGSSVRSYQLRYDFDSHTRHFIWISPTSFVDDQKAKRMRLERRKGA
jgi:hypothetical protein